MIFDNKINDKMFFFSAIEVADIRKNRIVNLFDIDHGWISEILASVR